MGPICGVALVTFSTSSIVTDGANARTHAMRILITMSWPTCTHTTKKRRICRCSTTSSSTSSSSESNSESTIRWRPYEGALYRIHTVPK